jgi:hypothetical protein
MPSKNELRFSLEKFLKSKVGEAEISTCGDKFISDLFRTADFSNTDNNVRLDASRLITSISMIDE